MKNNWLKRLLKDMKEGPSSWHPRPITKKPDLPPPSQKKVEIGER